MVDALTIGLLLTVPIVLVSAVLALRNPIAWRLARRNVRRGLGRSILVIFGLLIATTIVSGSLVIGDTVNQVSVHFAYEQYGYTDEGVYNASPNATFPFFPENVSAALAGHLAGNPNVAAVNPEVIGSASAFDLTTGIPQTGLHLLGADPGAAQALGDFAADNGSRLAGPSAGTVYLDDVAAGDINAKVGDRLALYSNGRVNVTVAAIVQDDNRGGNLGESTVFAPLATAQQLEGVSPSSINFVAITNTGSLSGGLSRSDAAASAANASLALIPAAHGLAAYQLLQPAVSAAETSGSGLTTLFLALGLFSIVAGAMLIVGIFVMMAEERKSEMGMLRAVGLPRQQLTLVYYFEGLIYSAGSALAGTFLGVGVGYALTYAFSTLFGSNAATSAAILASFTVAPSSLVIAYAVGFLLTLITVILASGRASRLNIVRALRAIPEPAPTMRLYSWLAVIGALVLAVGALIYGFTYRGTTDVSEPITGSALIVFGVALILSRFLPNRAVFTGAGLTLLIWGGYAPLRVAALGSSHTGTIFVVFVEGIMLVAGALLVYGFNSELVVRAVTGLLSRRPKSVPAVRIGLSYPSRRPFRTAVNLAIFSLVIFTVVAVASFGASVNTGLTGEITAQSGGYTFLGVTQRSVPDLGSQVRANATVAPLVASIAPLDTGQALVNGSKFPAGYSDSVYAPPPGVTGPSDLYASSQYNFSATQGGRSTAAIFAQLATDPTVAIVDATYAQAGVSFGFAAPHPSVGIGGVLTLTNPASGNVTHVTVIGVLSEQFVTGVFLNPTALSHLGYSSATVFLIRSTGAASDTHTAQVLKTAFFADGLQVFDFAQILQSSIQSTEGIIGLLEIFVALGLAVGIAGMGIVALRAVVERRTEIGMLRATGMTQRGIFATFLLEYSYIALLGIGIGTSLGILLTWEAAGSGQGAGFLQFTIPWANIALVIGVAYALTLAAIWGPSRMAARLPPAEAVRYSE